MSGENGHTTPPAEGAPPAVEANKDATKNAAADAQKKAPVAETKAAAADAEAEPAPAPAPASAEPPKESDKPAEGNIAPHTLPTARLRVLNTQSLLLTFFFSLLQHPPRSPPTKPRRSQTSR